MADDHVSITCSTWFQSCAACRSCWFFAWFQPTSWALGQSLGSLPQNCLTSLADLWPWPSQACSTGEGSLFWHCSSLHYWWVCISVLLSNRVLILVANYNWHVSAVHTETLRHICLPPLHDCGPVCLHLHLGSPARNERSHLWRDCRGIQRSGGNSFAWQDWIQHVSLNEIGRLMKPISMFYQISPDILLQNKYILLHDRNSCSVKAIFRSSIISDISTKTNNLCVCCFFF